MDWIGHANPAHSGVLAARGYLLMLARERDPDRAQWIHDTIELALASEDQTNGEGEPNVVSTAEETESLATEESDDEAELFLSLI